LKKVTICYNWVIDREGGFMERIVRVHIEKLPEGVYLATSDDIQGLVAQGRTVSETLEIARDVARKLLESQEGPEGEATLEPVADNFDYPLLVATS
jgi:predicted RNase H-like HicB family nuclease